MTFGEAWGSGWGADEQTCQQIYTAFREAGGNYIDTANNYTDGDSESIVGRLISSERDDVVVSTKFTLPATSAGGGLDGGHRKSLRHSLETSLRRLDTDYIDVLFIHAWDQRTPLEETMRALDDVVSAGKVLAIGVSNMPAWVIGRADLLADLRGWSQFSTIQVEYSLIERTSDRELLPLARELGLFACAWSPLARGVLAGKPRPEGVTPLKAAAQRAVDEAQKVASDLGVSPAQVALGWLFHRGIAPVLGARTLAQITDNLAAADLALDADVAARLDDVSEVGLGYPHEFLRDFFPQFAVDPNEG
jgi:aryl-alcohol dehydrogenase-like predicted oxidoreductase